jgi:hypothetical protein
MCYFHDQAVLSENFAALVLLYVCTACNLTLRGAAPAAVRTGAIPPAVPRPTARRSAPTPPILTTPSPSPTLAPTVDDFFARCPTSDEIAALDRDLRLQFETDPTAGTYVCSAAGGSADLTALQKRAYLSVLVMQQLTFDAPLPWTDKDLYHWFIGAVKGIRFRSGIPYGYCCDPADVIDVALDNSVLLITDRRVDPSLGGGLMGATILFVHEARHAEHGAHTRPDGQRDRTMAEMGAFGVQYCLELRIAQHGDRAFLRAPGDDPGAYRRIALRDAIENRRQCFCDEPTMTPGPSPTLAG